MSIQLPFHGNKKLKKVLTKINRDLELQQLWKCANINAVDRCGISDHGEVHIKITSNAALKMLRLLCKSGIEPNIVSNYKMQDTDAEVVVVLAALLHDIGISIHRNEHEKHSLIIAYPKIKKILEDIYSEEETVIITSEVMHAIIAHNAAEKCLTVEAGVLKVADAVDMSQGRSRIPFEVGKVNIHSVSAQAVESVHIEKGGKRPVKILISLLNSAGIYQVDELLKKKLQNSSIKDYVEVIVETKLNSEEKKIIEVYNF
ncbi:MAG: HD domain-containing protein [Victivallales bacterium]|nr:HD domain-containing protein [Victivallales bacterium]